MPANIPILKNETDNYFFSRFSADTNTKTSRIVQNLANLDAPVKS
jgi:hypothetical protein